MKEIRLVCPAGTRWLRDKIGIILVNEEKNSQWLLQDFDAMLWIYLVCGYHPAELANILRPVFGIDADGMKKRIFDMLSNWQAIGLLQEEEFIHGESDHQSGL